MCKISIIVPIFNTEKYLKECLESLMNQKLNDLEIILINDGSKDRSEEICKEFEAKDDRFKYYYIKNSGPSEARNYGISKATGEYIGFCDADDITYPEMYDNMYNNAKKVKADIVLCDIFSERDNKKFGFPWDGDIVFLEKKDIYSNLIPEFIGNESDKDTKTPLWGSVVRCIYRRNLLVKEKIKFNNKIDFAEDLLFTLEAISKSNRIFILNKVLYFYRKNTNSLMNSYTEYRENMFQKRVCLIDELINRLILIEAKPCIYKRLENSMRCYFHECIGNIFRNKNTKFNEKLMQLYEIINNDKVKKVFSKHDASGKKSIIYNFIKYRMIFSIYLYYTIRLR
ncbi:glycosyltransferase [Clostridium perfringens]|nr:glycosyltransferase [Clostridium perfringens]